MGPVCRWSLGTMMLGPGSRLSYRVDGRTWNGTSLQMVPGNDDAGSRCPLLLQGRWEDLGWDQFADGPWEQ